ncbi:MAG: energy transducer TonB [Acidobacteriota bacterium]|nr:energy transducer TonB [Acidobacteriota bacterium]
MFSNLVESSLHGSEFRRRGSFLLFTTASYALLFVIAGVISIYAYDARMAYQNLEIVTMMPLVDLPPPPPAPADRQPSSPGSSNPNRQNFDERRTPMVSVNRPDIPPKDISTKPNPDLPIGDRIWTIMSDRDFDAERAGGLAGPDRDGVRSTNPTQVVIDMGQPPPVPVKPKPTVVSKGVITSEALALPKPAYPPMAKAMRIQGKVSIQVVIDETGRVMSARAIDGPPLLKQISEKAAYQARFSPTRLGDQPVKVSGLITYNFVLEQ